MADAALEATEHATERGWMCRALHLIAHETRDRIAWIIEAIKGRLADQLEVEATPGRGRGVRRPR
jgi:hypothetical protein